MSKEAEYLTAVAEYNKAKLNYYDARDAMTIAEKVYFEALQALHPTEKIIKP